MTILEFLKEETPGIRISYGSRWLVYNTGVNKLVKQIKELEQLIKNAQDELENSFPGKNIWLQEVKEAKKCIMRELKESYYTKKVKEVKKNKK